MKTDKSENEKFLNVRYRLIAPPQRVQNQERLINTQLTGSFLNIKPPRDNGTFSVVLQQSLFCFILSWIVGNLADNNRFSSSRILRPP